jgi:hypothetical protein
MGLFSRKQEMSDFSFSAVNLTVKYACEWPPNILFLLKNTLFPAEI